MVHFSLPLYCLSLPLARSVRSLPGFLVIPFKTPCVLTPSLPPSASALEWDQSCKGRERGREGERGKKEDCLLLSLWSRRGRRRRHCQRCLRPLNPALQRERTKERRREEERNEGGRGREEGGQGGSDPLPSRFYRSSDPLEALGLCPSVAVGRSRVREPADWWNLNSRRAKTFLLFTALPLPPSLPIPLSLSLPQLGIQRRMERRPAAAATPFYKFHFISASQQQQPDGIARYGGRRRSQKRCKNVRLSIITHPVQCPYVLRIGERLKGSPTRPEQWESWNKTLLAFKGSPGNL